MAAPGLTARAAGPTFRLTSGDLNTAARTTSSAAAVFRYAFGPVTSRRLGRSLGVNNVPYKACTYSCVYCQLGRTLDMGLDRREFYDWRAVVEDVVETLNALGGAVDYVTFVPDGEPLLDARLGSEVRAVRERTGRPVAVLTNASLLFREDARADLAEADLVSLKVDSVDESTWRRVDRPNPRLRLGEVLAGIEEFARSYGGRLVTETMLVHGMNADPAGLARTAEFIARLRPYRAYLAVPVRPPAEAFVRPPGPEELVAAYSAFAERLGEGRVELLNMPEPPPPSAAGGDPAAWLLSVVAVHPLRLEHALSSLRGLAERPEDVIADLERRGLVRLVEYGGARFVTRSFARAATA